MKAIKFYLSDTDTWFIFYSLFTAMIGGFNLWYYQNIIFTNSTIRPENVSCYTTDVYRGLGTFWYDQYLFEWWLAIINWIGFVYPLLQLGFWAQIVTTGKGYRIANLVISVFVFIFFCISLGVLIYELIFCADFNFCRSCECSQKFNCSPNPGFIWRIIYQAYFLTVSLTFGFIAFAKMNEESTKERTQEWYFRFASIKLLKEETG